MKPTVITAIYNENELKFTKNIKTWDPTRQRQKKARSPWGDTYSLNSDKKTPVINAPNTSNS